MSDAKKTNPGSKLAWDFQMLADLRSGQMHDVEPHDHLPQSGSAKRARVAWQDKPRNFQSLYHGSKQRLEACWEAPSMAVCRGMVDQMHKALETATLQDTRVSVCGEKQRIYDRAMAMKKVLAGMDDLTALGETDDHVTPSTAAENGATAEHTMPSARISNKPNVRIQRSSNEAEPDASPDQCVMSVCLLMAALYEQTPFTNGELRRRIYRDFTTLKRHFRKDELLVMHGRSGPVGELFDAIKEIDRRGGLHNLIGIEFEDWKVHSRIDSMVLAEQLEVQVMAVTSEGPVGKFVCKFKTFASLCMLHMRLLREVYYGVFADTHPPKGNNEWMTSKDELDFIDFTEAIGRNIPFRHTPKTPNFYCWMYAPEVNASPEMWREIHGAGANTLPAMFDGVDTPDDIVEQVSVEEGYALDVHKAAQHDFRKLNHSMAPVGYPFADDLLGDYLRRLAAASKKVQGSGCQGVPFKHAATSPSGCKQEASHCQGNGTTCSSGQDVGCAPSSSHIKVEPGQEVNGACGTTCGTTCSMQGVVKQEAAAGGATGVAPPSCCGAGAAEGAGCGQNGCCQGAATANGCHSPTDGSTPQPAGGCTPQPTPAPGAKGAGKHTTANAEETGKLSIPLGVFLVGLICSGPFANTQIHVEDLLLMSINLNMFGAPKIWWWVPQESVQAFKAYSEQMTEGGRKEVYTKSISPFLLDCENQAEHLMPLQALLALGVKRTIQMPGTAVLTMPGYSFHFTMSCGFNIAESANLFLEVMGWTFEKLWNARPLEQYPEEEDDLAGYLRDTGVLGALGVPDRLPRHKDEVHRALAPRLPCGYYQDGEGRELRRCLINADQVKYVAMPPAMPVFKMDARGTMVPVQGTEVVVPKNVVITL